MAGRPFTEKLAAAMDGQMSGVYMPGEGDLDVPAEVDLQHKGVEYCFRKAEAHYLERDIVLEETDDCETVTDYMYRYLEGTRNFVLVRCRAISPNGFGGDEGTRLFFVASLIENGEAVAFFERAGRALPEGLAKKPSPAGVIMDPPYYQTETGVLTFRDNVRKFNLRAHLIRKLLGRFQEQQWPPSVESPFGDDHSRLKEAIRSANDRIDFLEFKQLGGKLIGWHPRRSNSGDSKTATRPSRSRGKPRTGGRSH